jgi:hypothetical protein
MERKAKNNKQVKQICTHYFFGDTTVGVSGVWDTFDAIRPDDYDSFEFFVFDPKKVGWFWSIPNKGHIPTEEEVQEYINKARVAV